MRTRTAGGGTLGILTTMSAALSCTRRNVVPGSEIIASNTPRVPLATIFCGLMF
ncbi:hypothetical protein PR003_g4373 [Phytophthora rubi]|uniref:Uncharacterized protein n=1 Tax=Phytophthora rubi TaxID=129364 RepID=A0A6A4FW58_9STRA|nr:hypothetical protein PR003_g4373 [Phytophthora rubi]